MTNQIDHQAGTRVTTIKIMTSMPQYGWLSDSAMRHLVHNAKPRINSIGEEIGGNGLDIAIIRIGKKILVDLDAFDEWVLSKRNTYTCE